MRGRRLRGCTEQNNVLRDKRLKSDANTSLWTFFKENLLQNSVTQLSTSALSTRVLHTRKQQLWKPVNNLSVRSLRHLGLHMLCEDCVADPPGKGRHFILSSWSYDIMERKSNPSLLMELLSFAVFSASRNSCSVQLHPCHFLHSGQGWITQSLQLHTL